MLRQIWVLSQDGCQALQQPALICIPQSELNLSPFEHDVAIHRGRGLPQGGQRDCRKLGRCLGWQQLLHAFLDASGDPVATPALGGFVRKILTVAGVAHEQIRLARVTTAADQDGAISLGLDIAHEHELDGALHAAIDGLGELLLGPGGDIRNQGTEGGAIGGEGRAHASSPLYTAKTIAPVSSVTTTCSVMF